MRRLDLIVPAAKEIVHPDTHRTFSLAAVKSDTRRIHAVASSGSTLTDEGIARHCCAISSFFGVTSHWTNNSLQTASSRSILQMLYLMLSNHAYVNSRHYLIDWKSVDRNMANQGRSTISQPRTIAVGYMSV